MKEIAKIVEGISEELCGAKDYSERYLMYKSEGDSKWAQRFKEMAQDELKHSSYLHELAVEKITRLENIYTAPEEMKELWNSAHSHYVEKYAWIQKMLEM